MNERCRPSPCQSQAPTARYPAQPGFTLYAFNGASQVAARDWLDGWAAEDTTLPIESVMQVPTLESARLRLLPLSGQCASVYERFYTDESASKAYGGPITPGAAWARLASDLGSWHLQGFGVWAVERRLEQDIIGTCGFWQGKGWPRELTWWLLPEVRRLGFAKEASVAAVNHAYTSLGWPEVQTYMNDENKAARCLVLALGGVCLGRRGFPDGKDRDLYRIPPPTAA